MLKMKFPTIWCKWIMEYVTIVSVSVLENGRLINVFKFKRGLCYGDPLSPFPFLLSAESLNILMKATV